MARKIVCQISRGIAPVQAIYEAMDAAHQIGRTLYFPIIGLPLIEAKNRAVELAYEWDTGIIMIEDDILVSPAVWEQVLSLAWNDHTVGYGWARGREEPTITYAPDGSFLSTGNVFTVIPFECLALLETPVFEECHPHWDETGTDFRFNMLPNKGKGSDTLFWYKARHLANPPQIVDLGRVRHLRHALNEQQDNVHPCEIREW